MPFCTIIIIYAFVINKKKKHNKINSMSIFIKREHTSSNNVISSKIVGMLNFIGITLFMIFIKSFYNFQIRPNVDSARLMSLLSGDSSFRVHVKLLNGETYANTSK